MTLPRWLKDIRFRLFYHLLIKRCANLVALGDVCRWTICDEGLSASSHILCAGAGNDISFEKALSRVFHCNVVLLDPSPTGIETARRERLPNENLKFLPIGLAGEDGPAWFQQPDDSSEGSFFRGPALTKDGCTFQCETLSTVMLKLGWDRIDLLKIDIEGFEYEVIHHMLRKQLKVRQICVEFHHGDRFGHGPSETIKAIVALHRAGYRLIHRTCWDHTLVKREA
jgi:FkbM family methyltransferase